MILCRDCFEKLLNPTRLTSTAMKPSVFLCLFCLFITPFVFGQNTKVFEDRFGQQGSVSYRGELPLHQLPLSGPYAMQWRTVQEDQVNTYAASGQLKQHLPHGTWIFEQGFWNYRISTGQSTTPEFTTQGKKGQWKGNFANSIPDGLWMYLAHQVQNKTIHPKPIIRLEQRFKDGKLSGSFQWHFDEASSNLKIKGQCNSSGEAHGTWTFEYRNSAGESITETHHYHNGLLLRVATSGAENHSFVLEHNQAYVDQPNHERYALGNMLFSISEAPGQSTHLYRSLIPEAFKISWNLEVFPYTTQLPTPLFRKLIFPLKATEQDAIGKSQQTIQELQTAIKSQLTGEMFIERYRSEALDLSISYLNATQTRLHAIDSLLQRTRFDDFLYKNRYREGLSHWESKINEVRSVRGTVHENQEKPLPLLLRESGNLSLFDNILQLLEDTAKALPEHLKIIRETHLQLQKEEELNELESQITSRFTKLQSRFTSEEGIGKTLADVWINRHLESLIKDYAQETEFEVAKSQAQNILSDLDQLEMMGRDLTAFDQMSQKITSNYTTMVYNPYNGENDIPLIVKKRAYQNIKDILWPWLNQRIQNAETFEEFTRYWQQQFQVYDAVMALAHDESPSARRLNTRIRKEKKPERLLRLLLP